MLGLQDQCGFKYKGEFLTYKDYSWIHSLHDEKKWKDNEDLTWGEWAKPVWPSNRSLQGSVQTPFIYDDRPRAGDFADALKEWYDMEDDKRKECGKKSPNICITLKKTCLKQVWRKEEEEKSKTTVAFHIRDACSPFRF